MFDIIAARYNHEEHVCSFCTHKSSRTADSYSSSRHHSTSLYRTQMAHATQQEVEPLLLIRSSGPVIYEVLGVGLLSLSCSVFVLTNFDGVPSGAPVAGCDDHGSYIIQSRRSASADRLTNNKAQYEPAIHRMFLRMLLFLGGRRHRSLCGRTRAPVGSALSWTPRIIRARVTMYGRRAPTDFGGTSAATVSATALHITHLTTLTSTAVIRAVRSAWVKGHVPFCPRYCIQHTVDTTLVVT